MVATRPWSGRWVSAKQTARRRISRSRWPNGRWWRWPAATGARPRSGPGRQRRVAPGPVRGQLHHAPGMRGASPRSHPPGRCPGGTPAAGQRSAAAAPLTYALPHLAGQARIELIRVHLALADLAGARTLMAEVDELLRRRPGLGTLPGEAEELRAQLSKLRGPDAPGASALTAAELRLLPMLATHLSFPRSPSRCRCPATPSRRKRPRSTASSGPRRGIRPSCGRGTSASSTGDRLAAGGLWRAPSDITWRSEENTERGRSREPLHLRLGREREA